MNSKPFGLFRLVPHVLQRSHNAWVSSPSLGSYLRVRSVGMTSEDGRRGEGSHARSSCIRYFPSTLHLSSSSNRGTDTCPTRYGDPHRKLLLTQVPLLYTQRYRNLTPSVLFHLHQAPTPSSSSSALACKEQRAKSKEQRAKSKEQRERLGSIQLGRLITYNMCK